jgi:hypothetical protein
MTITYTYEIIAVNEAARCMEVVYSATGHQTMHIGTRLPFEGEALENVIKAFAPVALWLELATPVTAPQVGLTGTIEPEPNPVSLEKPVEPESVFSTPASGSIASVVLE